jgi:uncharacterized protein (DUF305 family)
MKRNLIISSILSLSLALFGLALAQGTGPGHQHHGPGPQARGEMQPGMGRMTSQVESELDFLRQMIVHHQEAIDSARQVLEVAERQEVRALAEEIIEVQGREIEMMEGWLEAWYPAEAEETPYQPMMQSFEGLAPQEAERAFIEDMIMHHMMAVRDARQLLMRNLAEHEEVRALAQEIIHEQTREIAEMQTWLRDFYGVTAPMGTMNQMGEMMPGMMSQMAMHEMTQWCMAMMSHMMQSMMGEIPMRGMMGARYDQQTVEALTRAFLAGHQPDAEVVRVEPPRNLYTVTFRHGDTEGRLLVDADTGEVRLEPAGE